MGRSIIVLAGRIGAGKTTAAHYLEEAFHLEHKSFVETLWVPILKARSMDITRANLQALGVELMATWGARGIVDRLFAELACAKSYVIDDVRSPEVYEYMQSLASESVLIFLDTAFDSRFPRLQIRDNVANQQEQRAAEQVSTETSIDDLRDLADFVVNNDHVLGEFIAQLDLVATSLKLTRR